MDVRAYTTKDYEKVKKIHELYFNDEFECPNFMNGFICAFVVEENNDIIVAGGVRPIAEMITITNKARSARKRVIALREAVKVSTYACESRHFDQLHCFVQGNNWSDQVKTMNFRPTKGQALVLDIG